MAKVHKISSEWKVKDNVLSFEIKAKNPETSEIVHSFQRTVNMVETFGDAYANLSDVGKEALNFGAFTALRNSTGAAETGKEAEEAVDRRLTAWNDGEWGSERESSATPFNENALICKAIEAASSGAQSASAAAARLCTLAEEAVVKNNLGESFSALETKERAKIRKVIADQILDKFPSIKVEYMALEAAKQAEALKKKTAAAKKAKAELEKAGGKPEAFEI